MSKKQVFTEVDDLMQAIQDDIEETLADDVLEVIRDIEIEHVYTDVLAQYQPQIYERRSTGGISDRKNIQGGVKDMELDVYNRTKFDPGYGTYNHGEGLAELINDGNKRYFYDYYGKFVQPRPFIDNTEAEIMHGKLVDWALEKGLRKRGNEVK